MSRAWLFAAILALLAGFAATAPVIPIPSQVESPQKPEKSKPTEKPADKNAGKMTILASWGANEYIALFTAGTLAILFLQWLAGERADAHFQATERAYMQISHTDELRFYKNGIATIPFQVKNWGQTPGTVTDQVVGLKTLPKNARIPRDPAYEDRDRDHHGVFLVPTGIYNWEKIIILDDPNAMEVVNKGEMNLFLIGYVDYRDMFGGRYRAGYARQYVPARNGTGNNLVFVTAPRFNYDRKRRPGEGRDWTWDA